MDFNYKDWNITISSDKKNIILEKNKIILDELEIDTAWEYEKSGFLMYVREFENILYFYFRVEGNWLAYIPSIPKEIDSKILDLFGNLDILIAPFAKSEQKLIESIEPRMMISFAENSSDLVSIFGEAISDSSSYKLKSSDISLDKTALIILR